VAALVAATGDFDLAEEAAADAFAKAAERWPHEGEPPSPLGWLITTARRRAIDRLRRASRVDLDDERLQTLAAEPTVEWEEERLIPDERLELMFACCHPALSLEAQVALTLRALGGLDTDEIASAFLVAPEAMKRRLSRARAKVRGAGIPVEIPAAAEVPKRLRALLAVVYLIFNAGYGGRTDLADEAIRLGRILATAFPHDPEVHGLLALMLFHDARRGARVADGQIVRLAEQDRRLWDSDRIREAQAALEVARLAGRAGSYTLQAEIACLQLETPPPWGRIEQLSGQLARLTGSPVAKLDHAIAVAEHRGAEVALPLVEQIDLPSYQYLHSTRAELLRRLGRRVEARDAYERALTMTTNEPERRFLAARLADL